MEQQETKEVTREYKVNEFGIAYMELEVYDMENITQEQIDSKNLPTKMIKIYNSPKRNRLDYETKEEYVIRRQLLQQNDKIRKKGKFLWLGQFGPASKERMQILKMKKELHNQQNQ